MPRGRKKIKLMQEIRESPEQLNIYETPNSHSFIENQSDNLSGSNEQIHIQNEQKRQNTLSILTKRFTKLIKSKQNFILDINEATRQLGVQKRRIYDITNVLQGIGYIQKIHKNKMRWIGGTMDLEISKEISDLDTTIESYVQKNKIIEEQIVMLTKQLKMETEQKKYLNYFVEDDLKEILGNLSEKPGSMIVVMAQEGTTIELKEGAIIIQKNPESNLGLNYCKLGKDNRFNQF